MDISALEEIGLTHNEAQIYCALSKSGLQPVGNIAKNVSLHRSRVYIALEKLIQLGLVNYTMVNSVKYFKAKDPSALIDLLNEKKSQLLKVIPLLTPLENNLSSAPKIEAYQGIGGMKSLLNETLEGESYNVLGGPKKAVSIMGEVFWENYNQRVNEKKISSNLIFNEDLRDWSKVIKPINQYTKIRFLRRQFDNVTQTFIFKDKICILIWNQEPFGMIIRDASVARAYNQFFSVLWKEATN